MRTRSFMRRGAVTFAATALVAAPMAVPAFASSPETDPAPLNGYRSVGYVMADTPVSRDYQIADIINTGAINDVTHINYAFGNVTTDLVCDITNPDTSVEGYDPSNPDAGDAFNDYLRLVSAEDSVDDAADSADQALAGNFNQLRKLKAAHPDTKILISLGGWTWSDNFSEAAASAESRSRLVESCIDIYLKGNLPTYGAQGGEGVAAGIFDGIDVDWEWPVNGGETANAAPEDKENFLALMAEFREQLDAYGAQTQETYLLTAFAPVGANANDNGWRDPRLFKAVDWLNVQGYDYAGGWTGTTGHQGNLHPDGDNNWGLALAPELQAYINAGARPDQLNAGLAAYGQGWKGVEDGSQAWQPVTGSYDPRPYYEIRNVGEEFFSPELGAAWRYDAESGDWWSLDTPDSVQAKAEHVAEQGYGGVMWWDLSGDHDNELGSAAGDVFEAAEVGPLAAPVLTGGDLADTAEGEDLAFTPTVLGRGPLTFAVADGELPDGLTLNETTGMITGVAPAEGSYTFAITATNAFGTSAPAQFVLLVTPAAVDPAPTDPADPDPTTPAESDPTEEPVDPAPTEPADPVEDEGTPDGSIGVDVGGGELAQTGFDASVLLVWAFGLVAIGSGAMYLIARKRQAFAKK